MCACADSALSMMVVHGPALQLGGSRGIRSFDHVIRAVVMAQAMYGVLSVALQCPHDAVVDLQCNHIVSIKVSWF